MQRQRFHESGAHGFAAVEAGVWILEHHLHVAPEATQRRGRQRADILAIERDRTGGRFDQPQKQPAQRRFARTGFPDNAQNFAGCDCNVDRFDSTHDRAILADHAPSDDEMPRQALA
jgi:hypothetical protein